jgi:[ribosomal protein S18]-alanine N-acetyltransferase
MQRPAAFQRPFRIRAARDEDLAPLVDLENRVFETDRMSARQWRRHLGSGSASVIVAERDRRVIGAAVVFFHGSHPIARLYSISVAPEARGEGVGEALLVAAERLAKKRGSAAMRLEVRTDNGPAQKLYERHGYGRVGVRRHYYEDGRDAMRYEKALSTPHRRASHAV